MKKCAKCNKEKDLLEFGFHKSNKDGLQYTCKCCRNNDSKKYRKNNKRSIIEYRKSTKEKMKEYSIQYYKLHKETYKERRLAYDKEYYKEYKVKNKEKINEYMRIYNSNRRKVDPLYRMSRNIRSMLSSVLKKFKKSKKTVDIIGCTFVEFKLLIESKFEPWMTWDNYGRYNGELNYGWDIDHIIPISSAKTEGELLKLNHYGNLQPLCSKINRDIKKANLK